MSRVSSYAGGADRPTDQPAYLPVLQSLPARKAVTSLEWRIIKHLYAGMAEEWICDTLGCRIHDITRARHRARPWMGPQQEGGA